MGTTMNRKLRETLGLLALTAGFTIRFDLKGIKRKPITRDPTMIFLPGEPVPFLPDRPSVTLVIGGVFGGRTEITARVMTIVQILNDRRRELPGDIDWTAVDHTPFKKPRRDIHGVDWYTITIVGSEKPPIF